MTTFDEILKRADDDTLTLSPDWGQGRALFGGLVGALAFQRMQDEVAEGRPLRALQIAFVGPVAAEQPLGFETRLLREGKTASQVQTHLVQEDSIRLAALGSFGGDRESTVALEPEPAPSVPAPGDCQALPFQPGVTPEFTRHIEMRWGFGALPFTGQRHREMGGWMRFREAPEHLTDAHIIALVDAWPPAVLQHLKGPAPASSMSWSLEMVHPRPELDPAEPLLYRAVIDQAGAGYGHTDATIWSRRGELVAMSRQAVTVFG
ncbi:acyl-CoA thioesterase II [Tamilnaduibacter salinus]|uniref:Acyl-CoA thioesterase II n=1 Tax=Tamilnaduibacter salinus TaxID=1484056 RepID=A0A2A2I3N6_9GAMM|nr:thioesterase family protein [Tamilnaduibacter salinus]PAV26018.1 acyl-CoA thioesterase II [Tamilnaduibacter salinus]